MKNNNTNFGPQLSKQAVSIQWTATELEQDQYHVTGSTLRWEQNKEDQSWTAIITMHTSIGQLIRRINSEKALNTFTKGIILQCGLDTANLTYNDVIPTEDLGIQSTCYEIYVNSFISQTDGKLIKYFTTVEPAQEQTSDLTIEDLRSLAE